MNERTNERRQALLPTVKGSSIEVDLRSNLDFLRLYYLDDNRLSHVESSIMLLQEILLLMGLVSSVNTLHLSPLACEYNSTSYLVCVTLRHTLPMSTVSMLLFQINAEWTVSGSCQTCKCLPNQIIVCRNRTCQMPKDCRLVNTLLFGVAVQPKRALLSCSHQGEQLTIKTGTCCPACSKVRRSCLYDGTAILVGLLRLAIVFSSGDCFLS